jgi:hypothetical protein
VHVTCDRGWQDVGRVVVPDVEYMMGLELMRADQPALQWHMVAQQRVGDDALAAAKVFS